MSLMIIKLKETENVRKLKIESVDRVENPKTGRMITKTGTTYKKLVKEGVILLQAGTLVTTYASKPKHPVAVVDIQPTGSSNLTPTAFLTEQRRLTILRTAVFGGGSVDVFARSKNSIFG